MENLAEHFSLLVGIITAIAGGIAWYGAAVKKAYASERDFNHLRNAYEGLSVNVATLDRMLDARLDEIQRENLELRALMRSLIIQLGGNAQFMAEKKDD